mmetsp:Transcript_32216/g.92712  ORF Transcript_32216/g.92712 Transcript_32216/m.92712 type:complete len:254 (-) Transcript_32216:1101-1862(-)
MPWCRGVQLPDVQRAAPKQSRRQAIPEVTQPERLRKDNLCSVGLATPDEATAQQLAEGDGHTPDVSAVRDGQAQCHLRRPLAQVPRAALGEAPVPAVLQPLVQASTAKVHDPHGRLATRRRLDPDEVVRLHVVVHDAGRVQERQAAERSVRNAAEVLHICKEARDGARHGQAVLSLDQALHSVADNIVECVFQPWEVLAMRIHFLQPGTENQEVSERLDAEAAVALETDGGSALEVLGQERFREVALTDGLLH